MQSCSIMLFIPVARCSLLVARRPLPGAVVHCIVTIVHAIVNPEQRGPRESDKSFKLESEVIVNTSTEHINHWKVQNETDASARYWSLGSNNYSDVATLLAGKVFFNVDSVMDSTLRLWRTLARLYVCFFVVCFYIGYYVLNNFLLFCLCFNKSLYVWRYNWAFEFSASVFITILYFVMSNF